MPNPVYAARARTYQDPALGTAFENVASLFAPPSPQDAYAAAQAGATNAKAQRLSDLFRMAQGPDVNQQVFDRANIAAGNYAPNASYYGVDTKATTDRRGQDIESGDRRYNTDTVASTTRRGQDITADTDIKKAIMQPTPEGAVVTRPPTVAKQYDVPGQTVGVLTLKPGETASVPDETPTAPSASSTPPTTNAAPASPDDALKAKIMGETTPGRRTISAPAAPGAGPFNGTGLDAQAYNLVLRGDPSSSDYAAAYAHLASPRVQIDPATQQAITITPDMSWARKPTGQTPAQSDAAPPQPATSKDGSPAPAATPTSTPEASSAPGTKGVTVAPVAGMLPKQSNEQALSQGFANRMDQAEDVLSKVQDAGKSAWNRFMEGVPGGNYLESDDYQRFQQARDNFINAQLRRESGAAISAAEYTKADKQYFPQPGDGPEVIAQKAANRRSAIDAMIQNTGPGYKAPAKATPALPRIGASGEGYDQLAPGAQYTAPDGSIRTKGSK